MGRKTKEVKIPEVDGNRDSGKVYMITEKSARQTEKWAARAILALQNAGVNVESGSGIAGIAAVGAASFFKLSFAEFEPLLDEMLTCVEAMRDPKIPTMLHTLIDTDTEEVSTLLRLRVEVLMLHTDFLPAEVRSQLTSALAPLIS